MLIRDYQLIVDLGSVNISTGNGTILRWDGPGPGPEGPWVRKNETTIIIEKKACYQFSHGPNLYLCLFDSNMFKIAHVVHLSLFDHIRRRTSF